MASLETDTDFGEVDWTKEVDWKKQEKEDEAALQRVLDSQQQGDTDDLFDADRPLNTGEKADDAEDFEDIGDDDLPDEVEATGPDSGDIPGLTDDNGTSHDTDDLFGEGRDSSPFDEDFGGRDPFEQAQPSQNGLTLPSLEPEVDLRELNFPEYYGAANQDPDIPAPAESEEALVKQAFPSFQKGVMLDWNELLPPKKAHFIPKVPVKVPKPLAPTKVSLDIAPDQEKLFRAAGPAQSNKRKRIQEAEAKGLVAIVDESSGEESDNGDFDWTVPAPDEIVAPGVTWSDLQIICADWDSAINPTPVVTQDNVEEEPMDEWEREFLGPAGKRRKITHKETDYFNIPQYHAPSFDNFLEDTARIGKRVVLDLNDPHLLIDIQEYNPTAKRQRLDSGGYKRTGGGGFSASLKSRFNYSNDEAYDALKENSQHKVRSTLGNFTVEHSLPALKLQWPFYRVVFADKELRSYKRPPLQVGKVVRQNVYFNRVGLRKKKAVKGRPTQEVFASSADLSLSEHYSTATLLEYSEEHPNVLSNFGMGNRIINYYRRKTADDAERPQPEDKVGDVTVLLPEDKSPFAIWGEVDPGKTVRTIHNAMYRAPIFKHAVKSTDFLVIRSTTGVAGHSWYIRNIDNLFAVGQQLPLTEVPGPHARKVTNAAKNRMKMIAFRKIRKDGVMTIGDMTAHIAGSSDMQNRQKLKEFLSYDKGDKVWRMKPGEVPPPEEVIRSMVTPEEVALNDATQVGHKYLLDSGYDVSEKEEEDDSRPKSLTELLAPWETSKVFLQASKRSSMLQLHGEGDPSGCGLAISMLKTSMKGGYVSATQGPQGTSEAAMLAEKKANGGHSYNVKKQNSLYDRDIRDLWDRACANLSDPMEHEETEFERDQILEDARLGVGQTPHSIATPANFDDSASQFSIDDNEAGKSMRITRTIVNKFGQEEETTEIVTDPRVWQEYQKRRRAINAAKKDVFDIKPTGDADLDKEQAAMVKKELARLERNKERRHAREKAKGKQLQRASTIEPGDAGSPSATPAPSIEKPTGTTRKCANCGQTGHIKTNKKLCPMLNGTMKPEDNAASQGGFGAITTPSFT